MNILPLGPQYSNLQRAAPIRGILGRGGNKKERVLLSVPGAPLQDNCKLERMQYAVAGKIITREEALKQVKKKGLQKNVVVVVNSTHKDSQKVEQHLVLVNQASFAKRHGLSLIKVHQAAKKSNRELFEQLSKNEPSSSVFHQNNDFTNLAAERIKAIAKGQSIVKEACLKLRALHNDSEKQEAINEYLEASKQIADKSLKQKFQKMLKNGQNLKNLRGALDKFQNILKWENKNYENPLASLFENPKEIEFRSAVWDIFQQSKPIAGQGEIVISGYVMADGKGDYIHMQNMAKKLHKLFPERKIRLIVVGAETQKDKLPLLDQSICTTNLSYSGNGVAISPFLEKSPFDTDMSPLIHNADLWISGPVGINGLFDHLYQEAQTKGIAFTEYDTDTNLNSGSFGSKVKLGLQHAGVFTQKIRESSWNDVQNETLKTALFGSSKPKKEAVADYFANHQLLMCYQSDPSFFFDQAVQFSNASDPEKSIDICFPGKKEITTTEDVERLIFKDRLKELGVGSVKWIASDGTEIIIPIQEKGKELRIINPGMLTKKDFKLVTLLSAPLVGCTGDHSLIQALSYGKIPAYEMVLHKRGLALNLHNLSVKKFGEEAALSKFINSSLVKKLEVLDPIELVAQAKELGESIRENSSFNKHLKGMVNTRLYEASDPEFAAFKAQLEKNYLNGTMSLEDLKKQLRDELVRKDLI